LRFFYREALNEAKLIKRAEVIEAKKAIDEIYKSFNPEQD